MNYMRHKEDRGYPSSCRVNTQLGALFLCSSLIQSHKDSLLEAAKTSTNKSHPPYKDSEKHFGFQRQ